MWQWVARGNIQQNIDQSMHTQLHQKCFVAVIRQLCSCRIVQGFPKLVLTRMMVHIDASKFDHGGRYVCMRHNCK